LAGLRSLAPTARDGKFIIKRPKAGKQTWMMMDSYGFMDYMDYGLWMDYNIIKSINHHISGLWIYMNLYGFMVYSLYFTQSLWILPFM